MIPLKIPLKVKCGFMLTEMNACVQFVFVWRLRYSVASISVVNRCTQELISLTSVVAVTEVSNTGLADVTSVSQALETAVPL